MISSTKKRDVAINVRNIPYHIRKRFKEICVNREISMQDCIIEMVIDMISKDKKDE